MYIVYRTAAACLLPYRKEVLQQIGTITLLPLATVQKQFLISTLAKYDSILGINIDKQIAPYSDN